MKVIDVVLCGKSFLPVKIYKNNDLLFNGLAIDLLVHELANHNVLSSTGLEYDKRDGGLVLRVGGSIEKS